MALEVGEAREARGTDRFAWREAQTVELFRQLLSATSARACQALRAEIVLLNVPVAESVAARYTRNGFDRDDLAQVARVGLVEAVSRFDPDKGHHFLSFAVPTIAGEVKRHFRDHGWSIRPTRRVQETRLAIARCEGPLTQELGRLPRPSEIARHTGIDVDDVVEAIASEDFLQVLSLDAPVGPQGSVSIADSVGRGDRTLLGVETHAVLGPILASLSDHDKWLLHCRFDKGWTQQEIANQAGVSQMQISRRLSTLLAHLRTRLEEVGASPELMIAAA